MKQRVQPRGTYSRGAGKRPRSAEGRGDSWYGVGPSRPRSRPPVAPGCVGVESWGQLPARPPGRRDPEDGPNGFGDPL